MIITVPGPFTRYSATTGWQPVEKLEFGEGKSIQEYVLHDRRIYCYLLITHSAGTPQLMRGYFDPNMTALLPASTEPDAAPVKEKGRWTWTKFKPNHDNTDGMFSTILKPGEMAQLFNKEVLQKILKEIQKILKDIQEIQEIQKILEDIQKKEEQKKLQNIALSDVRPEPETIPLERGLLNGLQAAFISAQVNTCFLRPNSRSIQEHGQILQAAITHNFEPIKTNSSLYGAALMLQAQLLPSTLMKYGEHEIFRSTPATPVPIHIGYIWHYVRDLIVQEIVETNKSLTEKISLEPLDRPHFPATVYSISVGDNTGLNAIELCLTPNHERQIEVGLSGESQSVFLWLVALVSSQSWFKNFPAIDLDEALAGFCRFQTAEELLTPPEMSFLHETLNLYLYFSFANLEFPIISELKRFVQAFLLNDMKISAANLEANTVHADRMLSHFFATLKNHLDTAELSRKNVLNKLADAEKFKHNIVNPDIDVSVVLNGWRFLGKLTLLRLARNFPHAMQDERILTVIMPNFSTAFLEAYFLNILASIKEIYRLTGERIALGLVIIKIAHNKTNALFNRDFACKVQHEILMAPECFRDILIDVLARREESQLVTTNLPIPEIFNVIKKPLFKLMNENNAHSNDLFLCVLRHAPRSLITQFVDSIKVEDLRNITHQRHFFAIMTFKIFRICNQDLANPELGFKNTLLALQSHPEYRTQCDSFVRQVFIGLSDAKIADFFQPISSQVVIVVQLFPHDIQQRCVPETTFLAGMASAVNNAIRASVDSSNHSSAQNANTARNRNTFGNN